MPLIEDDPFGGIKREVGKSNNTPKTVSEFHGQSDVDSSVFAQHHTLGIMHHQAAFGDHTHNGRDSYAITIPSAEAIVFGTGVGQTQIIRKPSNTDRGSAGALVADPDLVIPVLANASYIWDAFIMYSYAGVGASAFDLSYDFTIPSGTNIWADDRVDTAVTTGVVASRGLRDQGNSGNPTSGVPSTTAAGHDVRAVIRPSGSLDVGGSGGNLTFRWCQTVSTVTALRVAQRSWLRAIRVA